MIVSSRDFTAAGSADRETICRPSSLSRRIAKEATHDAGLLTTVCPSLSLSVSKMSSDCATLAHLYETSRPAKCGDVFDRSGANGCRPRLGVVGRWFSRIVKRV